MLRPGRQIGFAERSTGVQRPRMTYWALGHALLGLQRGRARESPGEGSSRPQALSHAATATYRRCRLSGLCRSVACPHAKPPLLRRRRRERERERAPDSRWDTVPSTAAAFVRACVPLLPLARVIHDSLILLCFSGLIRPDVPLPLRNIVWFPAASTCRFLCGIRTESTRPQRLNTFVQFVGLP